MNAEYSINELSQSSQSFNKTQKDSFYPQINLKDNVNKSNHDEKIKKLISQRAKNEQKEDMRIKEDIHRVKITI